MSHLRKFQKLGKQKSTQKAKDSIQNANLSPQLICSRLDNEPNDSHNAQSIVDKLKSYNSYSEEVTERRKALSSEIKRIVHFDRDGQKKGKKAGANFSREQKQVFKLPKSLQIFCEQHKLREKMQQIKYSNTLKKIKQKGRMLSCEVRPQRKGIQFQFTGDRQRKVQDIGRSTFAKQFNRFFKKKLVTEVHKCQEQAVSLTQRFSNECQDMTSSLVKNQLQKKYKKYDCNRIQAYLKAKATQKNRYAFYIKKQLEDKVAKTRRQEEVKQLDNENILSEEEDEIKINVLEAVGLSKKCSSQGRENSPKRSSRSKNKEYQEDIQQFQQICQFFYRIQHELLRYLPNNHLSHKIESVIDQVEHSDIMFKIFRKCNLDLSYFTSSRIVSILKKFPGILGTMNYIVNVIKLNISAERRKRFKDTEKNIEKFQKIIKEKNSQICSRLAKVDDFGMRKHIYDTMQFSKKYCPGMNQAYKELTEQTESQDTSEYSSVPTNIICQILKFQTLIK